MAEVRCPKCRASIPDGHRRTARCHACHEPLGTCRYCRFYDLALQDCTHLSHREIDRVIDPDEVGACSEFSSRLRTTTTPVTRRMLLRTILLATVAVSAVAFLAIYLVRRAATLPVVALPFKMSVSTAESTLKEDGIDLSISLLNTSDEPVKNIEVRVAGRGMSRLSFASVTPPDTFRTATENTTSLVIEELPVGDSRTLALHYLATRTGKVPLIITATTSSTEGASVESVESDVIP